MDIEELTVMTTMSSTLSIGDIMQLNGESLQICGEKKKQLNRLVIISSLEFATGIIILYIKDKLFCLVNEIFSKGIIKQKISALTTVWNFLALSEKPMRNQRQLHIN